MNKMNLKTTHIVCVLVLTTLGCQKEELQSLEQCHQMGVNSTSITEKFKPNYTIQFPLNYIGQGHHFPAEAPVFYKESPNDIIYYFEVPCATDCHIYFGESLNYPIPDKIVYEDYTNQYNGEILDNRIEFCIEQELYMILYYSLGEFRKSRLFIKVNGEFKEGLFVEFDIDQIGEVIEVLKTIKNN